MENYPSDLVILMDELPTIDFFKLSFYKMSKMKIESIEELIELEKVMTKAMDLSTKMKLSILSPALRDQFFKVMFEKGLDKPPSILTNIVQEQLSKKPPKREISPIFPEENEPKLFQNTSKPADVDPNTYKEPQKLTKSDTKRDLDPYKSGMLELDSIKQGTIKDPSSRPKSYRDESPSPPRAYRARSRARSQSRPRERESRQSRSPPPYKRSSSRHRPSSRRSRSRSPPSVRSYRHDDRRSRSPPSARAFSRRSRSPPSVRSFSRRSRSPPSVRSYSRKSRSPPSVRSYSRKSRSPPSVRETGKDDDRDDEGGAKKSGLSFSLLPRKKITVDKPPFKF